MKKVEEERVEVSCDDALVADVVAAVRSVHSYEEPVIDIYSTTNG